MILIKKFFQQFQPINIDVESDWTFKIWYTNLMSSSVLCIILCLIYLPLGYSTAFYFTLALVSVNVCTYFIYKYFSLSSAKVFAHLGYGSIIVISPNYFEEIFVIICFLGIIAMTSLFLFTDSRLKLFYYITTCFAGLAFVYQYLNVINNLNFFSLLINSLLFIGFITFIFIFLNQFNHVVNKYTRHIKERKMFLQSIIDSIPSSIFIKNHQGDYVYINSQGRKLLELPEEFNPFFHGFGSLEEYDFIQQIQLHDTHILESGTDIKYTEQIDEPKIESPKFFEIVKAPIYNQSPNSPSILTLCSDITNQTLAKEEHLKTMQLYSLLFDNIPLGISFIDLNAYKVIDSNVNLMPEYNTEEVKDRSIEDFLPKIQPDGTSSKEIIEEHVQKLVNHGTHNFQIYAKRNNGELMLVEVIAIKLPKPRSSIAVFISRDMTEQKNAEEQELILIKKNTEMNVLSRQLTMYTLYETQKNKMLKTVISNLNNLYKSNLDSDQKKTIQFLIREIDLNLEGKQDWLEFQVQFQKIYPNFISKLSKKYSSLTENELRHCAYIKMNLSSSEVADIRFVEKKAVEMARYRIKKKMGLGKKKKLSAAIDKIE